MILDTVKQILSETEYNLCLNCLGRQFALLVTGTTNKNRGESLLLTLAMEIHREYLISNKIPDYIPKLFKIDYEPIKSLKEKLKLVDESITEEPCYICSNIFSTEKQNQLADKITSHSKNYEFSSFLIGCMIPVFISEKEEILRSKFNIQFGEPLKSEFNREIGKIVGNRLPEKEVDFKNPEILFVVDLETELINVKSNPLFIEGRYRKLVRGIPQSIWHCRKCRGKGCDACGQTGRMYNDSVEEYITPYILQDAKGEEAKLHCSGREDIDALMLGNGRPFVVEIRQPKKRSLDLTKLETLINLSSKRRIDIILSGNSNRKVIRDLKGESSHMAKKYRMGIKSDKDIEWNIENIKLKLIGKINQATPNRVLHRRADLIRTKEVYDVKIIEKTSNQAEIEIYCQGGLYVKELMHGDEGRTNPSLSQIVDCSIDVIYLDVLDVLDVLE